MQTYLPRAQHRMCARHIYANWRKKRRHHEFQKMFWAIAKSCNREDFMYRKEKLAQKTPEGAKLSQTKLAIQVKTLSLCLSFIPMRMK